MAVRAFGLRAQVYSIASGIAGQTFRSFDWTLFVQGRREEIVRGIAPMGDVVHIALADGLVPTGPDASLGRNVQITLDLPAAGRATLEESIAFKMV